MADDEGLHLFPVLEPLPLGKEGDGHGGGAPDLNPRADVRVEAVLPPVVLKRGAEGWQAHQGHEDKRLVALNRGDAHVGWQVGGWDKRGVIALNADYQRPG